MSENGAVEGELLTPGGNTMLATELKAQRELALMAPRDESQIIEKAMKALATFPDFARKAYYVLPRGGKQIEGLSVKASRELIRQWKNAAVASRVVENNHDEVIVEGLAIDFETNVIFRRTIVVKKTYIPAESKTKIPVPKRQDNLTNDIQGGCSKAERNAALSMLPEYFKDAYFKAAKEVVGKKEKEKHKTPVERRAAMVKGFEVFKVAPESVEAYIAEHLPEASEEELLGHMRGVWNGINEGESKAAEVFGSYTKKDEKAKPSGPVSGAAIGNAKESDL